MMLGQLAPVPGMVRLGHLGRWGIVRINFAHKKTPSWMGGLYGEQTGTGGMGAGNA